MNSELKIYIEKNPVGMVNVYFIEDRGGDRVAVAKPVKIKWEEHNRASADISPTLSMDPGMGHVFLSAFANALAESDFKTEKDAKIQGTLDATRGHLEDLRKLVGLADEKPLLLKFNVGGE